MPPTPSKAEQSPIVSAPPQELAPEDFYLEGRYVVFTSAYHLKRGSCCESGCRHCPYGKLPDPNPDRAPRS
jgi:uncharacterized protein DUF5522